jgi:hypothetical protein
MDGIMPLAGVMAPSDTMPRVLLPAGLYESTDRRDRFQ